MPVDVRTFAAGDDEAVGRLVRHAFSTDLDAAPRPPDAPRIADARRLVAVADGRVVGHLGAWPLGHWLAGRRVPTAGIAAVVVDPAWRGRGVGSALLRAGLEAAAARGEALATLFPLTRRVYRRHGWEVAGERPGWWVDTAALAALDAPDDVTLAPAAQEDVGAMAALEAAVAPHRHGMLARDPEFARRTLTVSGAGAGFIARRDGAPTGHVVVAHGDPEHDDELFSLRVRELVAADPPTHRALLRLVGAHASGARAAHLIGPPVPWLELLLPERAVRPDPGSWRWMTRIVDLPGLVASRGWPATAHARVDLEVTDPVVPANAGRWRLTVADGAGRIEPGGDGRVGVDVGALASWCTGWASPAALQAAGRLRGAQERDLVALTACTAGPTPWVRDFF